MKKGLEEIKKFVTEELENYGYFDYKDIKFEEEHNGEYYYIVTIKSKFTENKEKDLNFKYDKKTNKIFVELGEDTYEEVNGYGWEAKYFWMALLKWEI